MCAAMPLSPENAFRTPTVWGFGLGARNTEALKPPKSQGVRPAELYSSQGGLRGFVLTFIQPLHGIAHDLLICGKPHVCQGSMESIDESVTRDTGNYSNKICGAGFGVPTPKPF